MMRSLQSHDRGRFSQTRTNDCGFIQSCRGAQIAKSLSLPPSCLRGVWRLLRMVPLLTSVTREVVRPWQESPLQRRREWLVIFRLLGTPILFYISLLSLSFLCFFFIRESVSALQPSSEIEACHWKVLSPRYAASVKRKQIQLLLLFFYSSTFRTIV